MSLRQALQALPSDRGTVSAVRELLITLNRHRGEWLGISEIEHASGLSADHVRSMATTLARSRVLDCSGDDVRYRYSPDKPLEIEVDAFVRRADAHAGLLRDNVARFRDRYAR